jgi:hypothetical protein
MSTKEEREFQIKLAELTTDVQIRLGIALAFMAILVTWTIGMQQIYFTLPSGSVAALSTLFSLVAGIIVVLYAIRFFMNKAIASKNKISELKKQYC